MDKYTQSRVNGKAYEYNLCIQFFKRPFSPVFSHIVPGKAFAIHGHVYSVRQGLYECQCRTHIKEPVRAAKFIRDHCACQYYGFFEAGLTQCTGCDLHRICTVCDHEPVILAPAALIEYPLPVDICHLQAVSHHQASDADRQCASTEIEYLGEMGRIEVQFACDLIILFVKSAACDQYLYRHCYSLILQYYNYYNSKIDA